MSYRLKVSARDAKVARFISRLQRSLQKALADSGKTQQEVALSIGVDRSVINRRLRGSANLTARSIAEFAYALDKDVLIEFVDKKQRTGSNSPVAIGNVIEVGQQVETTKGTAKPKLQFSLEGAAS
jgi:transcriptional regulator with XRE-family HTH domain